MIRILLIRHAETELLGRVLYGRMPGVHLSAEGIRQAHALARGLHERFSVGHVISSPLERARKTAEQIAAPQGLPVAIDEDLTEIDYGSWMGKPFSELRDSPQWRRFNQLRSITSPPGGEFMLQIQVRAWRSLNRILEQKRDGEEATVAVVTHGDVIRALLLLLLGLPIDHIHRLEISPASVTEVLLGGYVPIVVCMNQIFH
ncbi:MAG TPA: histidine phosphatase family protein [Bryobacteraceae bacterium]|jgi:probable phosphoglycerate mutase|nr:histidine phosphatase family protein [Bryobacteraceae bacterium]